jgi:integrase
MALTDTAIRTAKPGVKSIKLFDEKGLYLLLAPTGGKWWRLDYRFEGKRKTLSMGVYPDIGLKDARERRDEAKKLLANGIDPGENRKAQKAGRLERAANSFEVVAREWYGKWKVGKADAHHDKVIHRLENDVFPWLGGVPVAEVTAPKVLEVLRRIESRGVVETARRVKGNISQVMRYAIATSRAERDPCPDLKDALKTAEVKHFASIIDPVRVGELMGALERYSGSYVVRAALMLSPLVFVRPGELRHAKWADIDLDKAIWSYYVSKTKVDHLVPLSRQAVEILRDLQPLTGHYEWVFKGMKSGRPISNNTVNTALRALGYDTKEDITGHGFRAMARTLLAEELDQTPDWIERQLAHATKEANGTAYDRARFLKQRRPMMQLWADYLDKLKVGADVIPFRGNAT